jgi:transposase
MATTIDPAWRMPEAMWERVQDLLPVRKRRKKNPGRKPLEWRPVLDGIFFVLRTGCQWKAAPPEFGSGSSLHRYFQRLVESGFFAELWRRGLLEYEQLQGIDWEWQSLDGSMTKAPLGGEKHGKKPERTGRTVAVVAGVLPQDATIPRTPTPQTAEAVVESRTLPQQRLRAHGPRPFFGDDGLRAGCVKVLASGSGSCRVRPLPEGCDQESGGSKTRPRPPGRKLVAQAESLSRHLTHNKAVKARACRAQGIRVSAA